MNIVMSQKEEEKEQRNYEDEDASRGEGGKTRKMK